MSSQTSTINHQFKLAARPVGEPKRTDWDYVESEVPQVEDGQFLVQNLYISLDPAMRGWMNDVRSYVPPVAIGEVMRAGAVGRVITSRHPGFKEGEHVTGIFGVQEYAISDGRGALKVFPEVAPLPVFLSALGMPGMTAYFGVLDVGSFKEGDVVVVSAAAGAVGSVAGQVARIKGSPNVVGIAGGPEKCAYVVDELGFNACIDYKSEDVNARLRELCPKGIDIYFDNVGGDILDAALARLARGGRIVLCGAISQYNNARMQGPSNYMSLLVNRGRMQGFLVFDFADRYMEAAQEMAAWLADGRLKSREDIVEGIENFPETLLKLFRGENMGKLVLKVAGD